MDRGAWWAIAMGSQRVGPDLVTKPPYRFDYINFVSFSPVFLSLLLVLAVFYYCSICYYFILFLVLFC